MSEIIRIIVEAILSGRLFIFFKHLPLFICLSFSFAGNVFSANLFDSDSIVELTLTYDVSKLQVDKEDLREIGLPGKIRTFFDEKEYDVEVLARGKGSFDCQQPQLSFKFSTKENKGSLFEGIKKVKLFTKGTCLENKQDDEQDKKIIANYLIYKLYEEMTDHSFKTRLLKIHYTDTSGKIPAYTQYGFFLEPVKLIEKRLELSYVEINELLQLNEKIPTMTNKELLSKVNSFEFFIANLDYGVPGHYSHIMNDSGNTPIYFGEKNSKMFKSQTGEMYPFIYDFDISRFGYWGPMCLFGYRFFMGEDFNFECSVEAIKENLQKDVAGFLYRDDLSQNSTQLIQAFNKWESKYSGLISILGDEYKKGMFYFIKAFESLDLKN